MRFRRGAGNTLHSHKKRQWWLAAHSASAGNLRSCGIQSSLRCGSDLGFPAEEGLYSQCRPDNRRGAFGCSQQDLRHLVSQSDAFRLCKQAGMSAY